MNPAPVIASCLLLAGCGMSVERSAQAYRADNARARMAEYAQAQRSGDLLAMCVKSNVVSAAYRDAGDGANAEAWRAKNAEDCRMAYQALVPPKGAAD